MSAESARHLVVVDTDTGERFEDGCPECQTKEREIEGLQEAHRSAMAKVRQLRADKEAEARTSQYWPQAVEAFTYWKHVTGHPRAEFSIDRFFLLLPYLKSPGLDGVKLACDGAGYDPYHADGPNRNGHIEVYDGLDTIFKNRGAFQRHCNRAPRERIAQVLGDGGLGEPYTPEELRIKAEVILALEDESDPREWADRVAAAIHQAKHELTRTRGRP